MLKFHINPLMRSLELPTESVTLPDFVNPITNQIPPQGPRKDVKSEFLSSFPEPT